MTDTPHAPPSRPRARRFDWSSLRAPPPAHAATADEAVLRSESLEPSAAPAAVPMDSDAPSSGLIPLRVNDLKQFTYCPRIVFYQYAMPLAAKATVKMEHGKAVEPAIEQLEKRRKLREYGLTEGRRRFHLWLSSARLGLSGRLDLLIETGAAVYPVDFKDTLHPVRHNHHVQLCAYALLAADALRKPAPAGFIYRVPRDDVTAVPITDALRSETLQALTDMRKMIRTEHMPAPTNIRRRCDDCEYRNYCGDVF